jgi:prefoldin subunit 5
MPVRGHNKHGNGAGKKSDNFAELIKDKCSNLKEDNISVNDAIEDLHSRGASIDQVHR